MFLSAIKNISIVLAGVIVPTLVLDFTAQHWLFSKVSYTNSPAFDQKIDAMQSSGDEWDVLFVGSSEVRWGIDPEVFDASVSAAVPDLNIDSFNIALDGFSPGLMFPLLSSREFVPDRDKPRVIIVGLNLAESVSVTRLEHAPGACGQLQKPILTSPFARDAGISIICSEPADGRNWFESLAFEIPLLRYRAAIRAYLLGELPAPLSNDITARGFHPHPPDPDHSEKFWADQDRLREEEAYRYAALPPEYWANAIEPDGFFDEFVQLGERRGWQVVFFHLPTNPNFFEGFEKAGTVALNQQLLSTWVERSDGVFIDLGIKYEYDRQEDFADFRHLSARGAEKFSAELARAFVENETLIEILRATN